MGESIKDLGHLKKKYENTGVLAHETESFSNVFVEDGLEEYRKEGHHPAYIGEILNSRYVLIEKIGKGDFSTVWLSKDCKFNKLVAIKIMKSEINFLEASFDEVELLQKTIKCSNTERWSKFRMETLNKLKKNENFKS